MNFELNLNLNLIEEKEWPTPDPNKIYDIIIVGGGSAGINAALYAKRKGLDTVIIAGRLGGQVLDTIEIENYLGYKSISGEELIGKFEEHLRGYDIPLLDKVNVTSVKDGHIKEIKCNNNQTYKAYALIIATGSRPRHLDVPGEKEYFGRGVAYCSICDGPLHKDGDVIVAGGGDSAVEAAIDLARIAKSVKVVQRSVFRANKVSVDKLLTLDNVEIFLNTQITEIKGDGNKLTHIKVKDKTENRLFDLKGEGLFVEVGSVPLTDAFKDLVELNEMGEIIINKYTETNIKGVFAAGDVTASTYKQIIIATAEGAIAALRASDYLNKVKTEILGGTNGIFK